MSISPSLVERRVSTLLMQLIDEEPVIALHGPRSVGKSTVLAEIARSRGVPIIDLDEPATRAAVVADPSLATSGVTPYCVDEYQHAPQVLDAIKAKLNRELTSSGLAVLTGSTRQDALPRSAQSLTGRLHALTIWPLSQGEMAGVREDLLECLRLDPTGTVARQPVSRTTRTEYVDRSLAGGMPIALQRSGAARTRWFDDYVRLSLERDALELADVRQRQLLSDVLSRIAAQTSQILNLAKLGAGQGSDGRTIEGYVRLLEDLFLVARLPAWGKTLRSRTTSRPKVHIVDSGVAARLLRVNATQLAAVDPVALTEFGHVLETFVVGEIRKQVSWLPEPATLGHWRTSDGSEVDLVVEFDDGSVVAFEVKAGQLIGTHDLAGLRTLRAALGERFVAGVALTTGPRSYTVEDRIHVLPIDRLWLPVGLGE